MHISSYDIAYLNISSQLVKKYIKKIRLINFFEKIDKRIFFSDKELLIG